MHGISDVRRWTDSRLAKAIGLILAICVEGDGTRTGLAPVSFRFDRAAPPRRHDRLGTNRVPCENGCR